jgi:CBS domain-containing protein
MSTPIHDIMTPRPIAVRPNTSLRQAATILADHGFAGLPVVDDQERVVGIVTEYDLIIKGSEVHLPTLIKVFESVDLYGRDSHALGADITSVLNTTVGEVMNKEPLTIAETAPLDDAARLFSEHHRVNPLIVVNDKNGLVGVLSRRDIIRLFGERTTEAEQVAPARNVDASVNSLLDRFGKRFVVVSRFRTRTWLLFSTMFFLAGFLAALAFIIRVNY